MGYIIDISKYQKTEQINWSVFSKGIDLLIARLQYGSSQDSYYEQHIANAKQYNIPINSYVFPSFNSVDDAIVEAKIAATNHDKDSKVLWVDIESEYDKNMNPKGITKLSKSARLQGIQAYVNELRKNGEQKVGAYIAHNVYEPWGLASIIGIFDAVWIPRYGKNDGQQHTKPDYPCDLWQFTSLGKLDGYSGSLDMSIINSDKGITFFTESVNKPTKPPVTKTVSSGSPTLHNGDKGNSVKDMQKLLNKYGYGLQIDGDFGGNSEKALRDFQSKHGLNVDGICGLNSWDKLKTAPVQKPKPAFPNVLIKEGSKGEYVKMVQRVVGVSPDGDFGTKTKAAVKTWQAKHGLVADGQVGKLSWSKMF
jgi:peptidoglycan hydrolase-like protein with peptidoglycan-binding domain